MKYYVIVLLVYFGTDLLATWGLNLEFGVAGVANFAYIVLVAAGAYTYSVLTLGSSVAGGSYQSYVLGYKLPIVVAVLLAGVVTGVLGCIIGVTGLRRLRQDYQAMIMLVISIMATTVVSADTGLVNGNAGLTGIPNPLASFEATSQTWAYVILVGAVCLLAYPLVRRFTAGPMGRALRAMRDDEDAAISIGKNVVALRLAVQGVGGVLAGVSGALLAGFINGWSPSAWQYVETLALLTAIIVGGLGNDGGVVIGTALVPVIILQGVQFLPQINNHPQLIEDFGWMILGALTIGFIWLRPQGILPERRPKVAAVPATPFPAGAPLRLGEYVRVAAPRPQAPSAAPAPPEPGPLPSARRAAQDDLLVVSGLVKRYGGVRAVDGASFVVRRGSITGLIGPNGAGKSTVMSVVSGFVAADGGRVSFEGHDLTGLAPHRRARRGLVRTFQLPHEFRRLRTIENLMVAAPRQRAESPLGVLVGKRYWGAEEKANLEHARRLLDLFAMGDKAEERAGSLSGGQKRMLEVMRALMSRPTLLLLDEPMAGLSPAMSRRLEEVCLQLRDDGLSIVLIEHELGAVERLCDTVVVMAQGKVLSEGTMAALRASKEVQAAYVVG